ncbi:hypothetical protein [Marinomonas mediterranea]|jgi:hypothetical protein|uniref:Uncharacterized protein n=1 Tax=Marinomonas mediterranea (strain ATCC 700492 / JCM 21426 / NBRC 103028 / MMB-1) TaxID=717774 RepID=F2K4C6_MARM1|nr:hypothetical protein [Marinomonas mediterranea]ADZ92567.1 hypothetical protein Marme_3351 [Marinomonas mediterranea MMB-1]WCN10511.1 hypothetical protein GV055_17075 [Marinomonas mediterranea]WCN14561.1 hypothetical protein GV054_16900 [Marinomonas mediterranea]WCN18610.1 hypothetical protein GV053_16965 [Marinomonas mediterranea MMB-1]
MPRADAFYFELNAVLEKAIEIKDLDTIFELEKYISKCHFDRLKPEELASNEKILRTLGENIQRAAEIVRVEQENIEKELETVKDKQNSVKNNRAKIVSYHKVKNLK